MLRSNAHQLSITAMRAAFIQMRTTTTHMHRKPNVLKILKQKTKKLAQARQRKKPQQISHIIYPYKTLKMNKKKPFTHVHLFILDLNQIIFIIKFKIDSMCNICLSRIRGPLSFLTERKKIKSCKNHFNRYLTKFLNWMPSELNWIPVCLVYRVTYDVV